MKSIVTRFRAFQLGSPGSSFSYFAEDHFTLLEGRLTDLSRLTLLSEMELCDVSAADTLHITSWDADHCQANELLDLLRLVRPRKVECPGYRPYTDNGKKCQEIISQYVEDRRQDNQEKTLKYVTPDYIAGLRTAESLAFKDTFYNPILIEGNFQTTIRQSNTSGVVALTYSALVS